METLEVVKRTLNINCGILGHVDSGKTSLVKALSKTLSTCALDKHPQSQQRGITLDLGFSAFTLAMPEHLKSLVPDPEASLQFTLVDCPGHASLIRTIIGGAQIIDLVRAHCVPVWVPGPPQGTGVEPRPSLMFMTRRRPSPCPHVTHRWSLSLTQ